MLRAARVSRGSCRAFSTAAPFAQDGGPSALRRTHLVEALVNQEANSRVTVAGWVAHSRRQHPTLTFTALRDASGFLQVVFREEDMDPEAFRLSQTLGYESVVAVEGTLRRRPEEGQRPDQQLGHVELWAERLHVLNRATQLPFRPIEEPSNAVALANRFIHLRTASVARNLRTRSAVAQAARHALYEQGFIEVETPMLHRSTPEGAKEFLVPVEGDKAYALTQSPQQFKQLLMAGGVDRYFQVAKCFRDEGHRADRQPEFTQIDLEMAYVHRQDVMAATEALVRGMVQAANRELARPADKFEPFAPVEMPEKLPWMTYHEAMSRYGVDKPDLRLGMEICDVTEAFGPDCAIAPLATAAGVKALRARGHKLSRKQADAFGGVFAAANVSEGGVWSGALGSKLTDAERSAVAAAVGGLESGDCLLLAHGPGYKPNEALGAARLALGVPKASPDAFEWLWVVDFPLFERDEETGEISSSHHPFTAALPEDDARLRALLAAGSDGGDVDLDELLSLRSLHYDIVVNGWELGGGSIRLHEADVQEAVLTTALGHSAERTQDLEHLLRALRSGCPPHGGIALGLDRLTALLCREASLRDVIAFPKTGAGVDLMTGAPSPV